MPTDVEQLVYNNEQQKRKKMSVSILARYLFHINLENQTKNVPV